MKITILDDYQGVALSMADWSEVHKLAEVRVCRELLTGEALQAAISDADIICAMRERTLFDRAQLQQLPKLKLLITSGMRNAAIDMDAARELGIVVSGTPNNGAAAAEHTWALILAAVRHIPLEDQRIRQGQWQTTVGGDLKGKTLGIVGLGNLGQQVARVAQVFGMKVLAWSPNLTAERAAAAGVEYADKQRLLQQSDIVTLHMKLSESTHHLLQADDLALMPAHGILINTSRGQLVEENALITALSNGKIAAAGLDVFDQEPIAPDHPLLKLSNTVLTSHVGFVTRETYTLFYQGMVDAIVAFCQGAPTKVLNG
ncbi:D-2-hydroxyacid dehydrogenase family protein [Pokkaliibacter sp. MBI-7]|uniref:D-2-hydroxyacid dehydrogenase family protein n=1 Tax=Pokkaliibacter sp. MBI-7 TaxID=3040600 RepID=UPI0024469A06|nr:D-2-hydroxyacid dehydrogenase family protein [Pokkaliibacter sp. MBI-7]MDH2434195.1 D-2-hydroxyacid dehydrogenase family protein [Pokkaliibacter sp. MBI-7]